MSKKNQLLYAVLSICIIILSITFTLLDALIPLNVLTHPMLNFLMCIFIGFGVLCLVLAVKNKSPWFFFVATILLTLVLLYVLLNVILAFWWLVLVIILAFVSVMAIVSVAICGNKTEEIALNKSPEYKTYEQRKAEKANEPKEEVELPTLKSFKDDE